MMTKRLFWGLGLLVLGTATSLQAQDYTQYKTWNEVLAGNGAIYPPLRRITDPGTSASPIYTGFFWYLQEQFDATGRYALGMRVYFDGRDVRSTDRVDVGTIDLQNGNQWTKIGESTAWNWQQGNRLQWRPHSDEILWNDRSDDRTKYVTRVYNFKTGARRTLPRAIYTPSPDGRHALCRDFERPAHPGTDYVGIPDPYAGQNAPAGTGLWKMDLNTGSSQLIMSLQKMQSISGSSEYMAFFKYLWNPSGTRISISLKGGKNFSGCSMFGDGTGVRSFGSAPGPSHTAWHDDSHLAYSYQFSLKRDDGTGNVVSRLADVDKDSHLSTIPGQNGAWITADTYAINGFNYLFLYHIPTRTYVPLAKLRDTSFGGVYRIDLQGRTTRDGRKICIDASHEGKGRQMYLIDIGHILDHPPGSPPPPPPGGASSSSAASGFGASLAIDDNPDTLWKAANSSYPQWLQVDLGSSKTVTGAYIDWYLGQSTPYAYRIGVSSDGIAFTTVVDQTGRTTTGGNSSHAFSAVGRFVRLTVTGAGTTGNPAAVREFDISVAAAGGGLKGEYYDNRDFTALKLTRTDGTVDFNWGTGAPAPGIGPDTFSVRWSGKVEAPASGTYTFTTASDDGVRLWVNGQLLVNNWTDHAPTENSGTIVLSAGQKVAIRMEFYENGGGAVARLLWSGPGIAKQVVPKSRLFQ